MSGQGGQTERMERIENDVQRMKRTMHLLIFVGSGFCLCWLPLNVYNTVIGTTEVSFILRKT